MRHRIFGKQLGRDTNERQALLKNLARQIFTYGSIETTESKAKAVLPLVEHLAALSRQENLASRRRLFEVFQTQSQVNLVVTKMAEVFPDQKSNFFKTVRLHRRQGDDALIVRLSFVKSIKFAAVKKETVKKEVLKPAPKKVTKKTPAKS